jgi:8-oxo-dGTP pyrophosphatase MutT (NUDIX family)
VPDFSILYSPQDIQRAVLLTPFDAHAAHSKMAPHPRTMVRPPEQPGRPHIGAVLLVLYCKNSETYIVLIKRQETLKYHPGQISFPGGRRKKNESHLTTALRETAEETGVDCSGLSVLGELKPVYIPPSDFIVYPFVAWHEAVPVLRPDPAEVAEIIEIPVAFLCSPASTGVEQRSVNGRQVTVPYFIIAGHKAWGATAMMLSEFVERLRAAAPVLR